MKKKKYNLGGNLQKTQNVLGTTQGVAGLGDMVVPGLGTALNAAIGIFGQGFIKHAANKDIENSLTQMTVNTNPFGFALGGMLKKTKAYKNRSYASGGLLEGTDDLGVYNGASHEQNGIKVSKSGIPSKEGINEVEGKETVFKMKDQAYIFSDKLKI